MSSEYFKNKFGLERGEIKGVDRLDLLHWLRELDFKVGAEVGVYTGEYSRLICLTNPQMKLYGIDPWRNMKEYGELEGQEFEDLYQMTLHRLKPEIRKGQYQIIRKTSMEALKDFADGSLDFVYIDANHESPYVDQDIDNWMKKVRKGGILAGHDYISVRGFNYGIKRALRKYADKLFILGSRAEEPGVVRDRVRSWLIVV